MPIVLTDSDNISTVHAAERLQINLSPAKENVEEITVYYQNQLSTGV